jgi:hypothetical protein
MLYKNHGSLPATWHQWYLVCMGVGNKIVSNWITGSFAVVTGAHISTDFTSLCVLLLSVEFPCCMQVHSQFVPQGWRHHYRDWSEKYWTVQVLFICHRSNSSLNVFDNGAVLLLNVSDDGAVLLIFEALIFYPILHKFRTLVRGVL